MYGYVRTHRRFAGFTLFEMLVVLVLISVIAAASYNVVRRNQAESAAASFVSLQAREMAIFGAAAQKFAEEKKATWTAGQRQTITPPQLIADGKLQANWASRGGQPGVSPIGESYRAFAIKDATNVVRLVVADFGTAPTSALVRRAGYEATAASLQGYKARVADEILRSTKGFAGYVGAGTSTVRGVAGAFTEVLSAYFGGANPTMPVTVELVGWPEYVIPGTEAPAGPEARNLSCNVVSGMQGACRDASGNTQPCWPVPNRPGAIATHYQEPRVPDGALYVTRVPMCGGFGLISPGVEGVSLSFGGFIERYQMTVPSCGSVSQGTFQPATDATGVRTYQTVRVNDSELLRVLCQDERPFRAPAPACDIRTGSATPDHLRMTTTTPQTVPVQMLDYSTGQYVTVDQTFQPLLPVAGNTRTSTPDTRGHFFYCTPNS